MQNWMRALIVQRSPVRRGLLLYTHARQLER